MLPRSKVFQKLAKELYVAAKLGDPVFLLIMLV